VTLEDVRQGAYGHTFADTAEEANEIADLIHRATGKDVRRVGATRDEWLAAARQKFEQEVRDLLDLPAEGEGAVCGERTSGALQNCNEVFAVFKKVEDCVEVMKQCTRQPEASFMTSLDVKGIKRRLKRSFGSSGALLEHEEREEHGEYEVFSMIHEPVGVCWHHYGLSDRERIRGFACAVFSVSLCLLAIYVFVVYPSITYSLQYRAVVDASPGGMGSKVFGVLIGTSNWLLHRLPRHDGGFSPHRQGGGRHLCLLHLHVCLQHFGERRRCDQDSLCQ